MMIVTRFAYHYISSFFFNNANDTTAAIYAVRSTELDWFILLIVRYQAVVTKFFDVYFAVDREKINFPDTDFVKSFYGEV